MGNDQQEDRQKKAAGNTNRRRRLSTVDRLIVAACFVKIRDDIFILEMSGFELVRMHRFVVLNYFFHQGIPTEGKGLVPLTSSY
jgi:hypothetical protein